MDIRESHIDFIKQDTQKRGEIIISEIVFFGALYQLDVQNKTTGEITTIDYSAADNVMDGYRKIEVQIEEN